MARRKNHTKPRSKKTARHLGRSVAMIGAVVVGGGTLAAAPEGSAQPTRFPTKIKNPKLHPAQPLEPSDALVDEIVETRKKFGLRHDEYFVKDLLSNPGKYGAVAGPETGFHYATPEELKELKVRRNVRDDARNLGPQLAEDPEFAGMYIDKEGHLHVGFTRGNEKRFAQILEGCKHPKRVHPFVAKRSLADLESLRNKVSDTMPKLAGKGLQISRLAVDVETNAVQVGVVDLDNAKSAQLERLFGDVEISEVPLELADHRNATASPMRAGVRITMAGGGSCTSAWKAQDRTTGQLVMLTAGHCAPGAGAGTGVGTAIRQGTTSTGAARTVGTVDQTTWTFPFPMPNGTRQGAGPVDAMRWPLSVSSLPWLYGWDQAVGGTITSEQLEVEGASGSVVTGESVCSAGQFSPGNSSTGNFKNCGTVSAVNVSRSFLRSRGSSDVFTITNVNVGTYTSIPGDSGAPVWHYGPGATIEAVGINTGGGSAEHFSDIDRVENALNVDIRTF